MLNQNSHFEKNIAWNKISLKVPQEWEVDSLDADHMLIGENESPKLEIKWTDSPKKFTLGKYLKKFIARSQRTLNIKIHELPLPDFFSHPVKEFEFFFFSWESKSSKGNGTLIFCTHCKRLTIIRFFSNSKISLNSRKIMILNSFTDHPAGDISHWQVFGLNFSISKSFKLLEYSFKPGCYIINFKYKKIILTVFSWGPALFLLKDTSLSKFATQRLPRLEGLAKTGICSRGNYLEWSYCHEWFKNAKLLPVINRYLFQSIFRICNDKKENRILGVMIDSPRKNFNPDLINWSIINDIQEKTFQDQA